MSESYAGKINRKLLKKRRIINAAAGREPADLVLKNATYVNVFSNELCHADIAVAEGLIVGMGQYSGTVEEDCTGKIVLPGFLDAHIHLESSLVSPKEFVKAVLPHGTTTVITDPHEIANVMGTDGIEYMLQATEGLPVDVRFMRPRHPYGRERRLPGLPHHRLLLRPSPGPGPGGDDELRGHHRRGRPAGGEDRGRPGPP